MESEVSRLPDGFPERIGPYEILGVLGTGSMGVVFRARQEDPGREVALKLLRSTVSSTSTSISRRFQLEAHVLGRLQHPGIAQIYEAGTTDLGAGLQPWFAMERIEGTRLSGWAADRGTREKLRLLIQVCDAVHHAHLRGVVHRDLKPDNILVGADDLPRVLDFGVARVTDSDLQLTTVQTDVQSLIGTLPYMSPEQARGDAERLDARSDVYALGVLTYELLSGELPYDLLDKPVAAAARVIADDDPTPLSSVDRVFRGDLETIVGKALEKEPERRYASAEELAADLERYLGDEPIRARPSSTWYQAKKLARRNRKLFLVTAGAFVALLGGTITSTVLAIRESSARQVALEQATRAENIASFALEVFAPRERDEEGKGKAGSDVIDILAHAVERVEAQLADQPDLAAEMFHAIGYFYYVLGHVEDAGRTLRRSVEERRLASNPPANRVEAALQMLRATQLKLRDFRGSAEVEQELARLYERTLGPEAPKTLQAWCAHANALGMGGQLDRACERMRELAPKLNDQDSLLQIGATMYRNGFFDEAMGVLQRLLDRDATLPKVEGESDHRDGAAFQLTGLLTDIGRFDKAERSALRMMELAEARLPEEGVAMLAYATYMHAHVRHCLGQYEASEKLAREAIELFTANDYAVPFPWRELGMALLGQGRWREAEAALQKNLDGQRANTGDGEWYVGQAEALLGQALRVQGRLDEAEELGRAGVERTRRALRPLHPRLADVLEPLAQTLVELGRHDEAEAACLEALEIRLACMDEHAAPIASLRLIQAEILRERGETTAAFVLAGEALLDFQRTYRPDHPELARAHRVRARCAGPEIDSETREALWRAAFELHQQALGPEHPETAESERELGRFLSAR